MIPRSRTARILVGLLAGAIIVVGAGLAWARSARTPSDVVNTEVGFETTTAPAPREPKKFSWPFYGYDAARTHYYPLARGLRPPFRTKWAVRGSVLLEFTPVADDRFLYLLKNNAALYIIRRSDGKVVWKKLLGKLAASAPAVRDGKVFCTILVRKGSGNGRVVAIDTSTRKIAWAKDLPSRTETSPVEVNGTVYIGSENGTVYALRASDGKVRWSKRFGGAVKGGLAYSNGALFFGDYAGEVHSLRARDGKTLWTSGSGGSLGIGDGQFYATASVAFGRVYIGNTNGSMYSFSTKDGSLAWRKSTGAYVYSSAAVADPRGVGPTVYFGSYDGTVYALDARTGRTRWSREAGGRISGGVDLLGDLLFYSTLEGRSGALSAAKGTKVWGIDRGEFNPAITDGETLYLNDQTGMWAYSVGGRGR
ncbi:MAG: PQQ-binding-like beta-propeller repeat protein [Solirubrobacterales bacterium]